MIKHYYPRCENIREIDSSLLRARILILKKINIYIYYFVSINNFSLFLQVFRILKKFMANNFLISLISNKFFTYMFPFNIFAHAFTQHLLFLFKSKYCLYKKRKKKKNVSARIQEIFKHEIEACQILIVSRRYLSRECTEMSLRSFWRWRSSIDERSGYNGFHSVDRRWSPLVVRNSLHSKLLPLVSGNRPSTSFAGNQGPVPLRSSCEFDADETRLKDSSNPFPPPYLPPSLSSH